MCERPGLAFDLPEAGEAGRETIGVPRGLITAPAGDEVSVVRIGGPDPDPGRWNRQILSTNPAARADSADNRPIGSGLQPRTGTALKRSTPPQS
jgi:hypothetical protein